MRSGQRTVLDDLVKRGLRQPEFLIVDGGTGLEQALAALWGDVPTQRCTVHKHRNLLAHPTIGHLARSCKPALQSLHSRDATAELTLECGVSTSTSGAGKAQPMRSQHFRGNVFVANLPPEFSDEQLAEAFDTFGIVLSASIARDPVTGKRLRYGFVDIATERAAKLAVEAMNGAEVAGYNLDVRISEKPTAAKKPPRPAAGSQRLPPRMARPSDGGDEERTATFTPRPQPRRQPSFQVERRSLPRRPG